MIDQLDPDPFFYLYLIAGGGIALASGYASGLRLNVGALLIICFVFGLAALLMSLGIGMSWIASLGYAALAIVLLQLGYFTAIVARRGAPLNAPSSSRPMGAETQGSLGQGKRGSG